jgi:hypothetical protein
VEVETDEADVFRDNDEEMADAIEVVAEDDEVAEF